MNIANLEVLGNGGLIIYYNGGLIIYYICIKIISSGWGNVAYINVCKCRRACVPLSLSLLLFPESSLTEPEAQRLGQVN